MIIGQQQSEFCAVLGGNLPVIYPTAKQMFLLMTWAKRHQILYKSVIISVSWVESWKEQLFKGKHKAYVNMWIDLNK